MNESAVNRLCWIGLAAVTLYLLAVNQDYYRANTRAPTYDEAWYLETSLNLYHRLTGGGLREFWEAFRAAFGTKAPLIAVLPLPFYLAFGASYQSALLVNSLFLVVANVYLFLLARRLFSPQAGLAAVVFYQTMPLVCGLSRAVMAEYGLAALVIAWLYYLVASERFTRGAANFALGVVLGLGLLMKVLFPAFIAGPWLLVWLEKCGIGCRSATNSQETAGSSGRWLWMACARWPWVAIVLPALVIAGPWYSAHWLALLRFAWHSAYGDIGPQYGAGGLGPWIQLFINEGISTYYAAALLIVGAVAWAVRQERPGRRTLFLLAWLAPPLVAIAAASNQLLRFVVPLLPVFAIALAAAVFSLGRGWVLQAALAVALAVFPQRLYAALSYVQPQAGHYHPLRLGPFLLFGRDLGWAHPPARESAGEQNRVIEALRRLAPDLDRPECVVVAVEHVYLNANLLSYLNAYQDYLLRFTSLGYAESSAERAIERIYRLDARFLILSEGFQNLPPFLNQINGEIQNRIARGELPFRLRATVSLAHRMQALIYEREAPWERFAPGVKAPAPAHQLTADFAGGIRLLGYDWKRRDRYLWEISYYWTVLNRVGEDYRVNVEFRRGSDVVAVQQFFIGGGRHPFPEWEPGEVVKQTRTVYAGSGQASDIEARLWLKPWGFGAPLAITAPAEFAHTSHVRFRLSER